jgi:predicted acetyltransferase
MGFEFFDPRPLIDGELELVCPGEHYFSSVLVAASHPVTMAVEPHEPGPTRKSLEEFLAGAPLGHQPGDPRRGRTPAYHFWMRLREPGDIPLEIVGGIGFRVGTTPELEMFSGNLGYHVYPPARGHHFAERSCRLLLPLAKRHGMRLLWITCNPGNIASRKTCERLGATLVDIVNIPRNHEFYSRGERQKCRYRLVLE